MLVKFALIFFTFPFGVLGFLLFHSAWFSVVEVNGEALRGLRSFFVRTIVALSAIPFMALFIWAITL